MAASSCAAAKSSAAHCSTPISSRANWTSSNSARIGLFDSGRRWPLRALRVRARGLYFDDAGINLAWQPEKYQQCDNRQPRQSRQDPPGIAGRGGFAGGPRRLGFGRGLRAGSGLELDRLDLAVVVAHGSVRASSVEEGSRWARVRSPRPGDRVPDRQPRPRKSGEAARATGRTGPEPSR